MLLLSRDDGFVVFEEDVFCSEEVCETVSISIGSVVIVTMEATVGNVCGRSKRTGDADEEPPVIVVRERGGSEAGSSPAVTLAGNAGEA